MVSVTVKQVVKGMLPQAVIRQVRRLKRLLPQRRDGRRTPAEVFAEIYRHNLWGGAPGEFFSGEGTHHIDCSAYVQLVRGLVREHGLRRVVDIGCGDFQIGRQLVARQLFAGPHVAFASLDATRDELPAGDLVLVREVLQHLSNAEIATILAKLQRFRFALITEYQPAPENVVRPNIDKAHGRDTRIWDGSAVFPEQAPFSLPGLEVVLAIASSESLVAPGERIVTYLMRNEAARHPAAAA